MSDYRTIARPYAKAVYETAAADNTVAEWEALLAELSAIVLDAACRPLFFHPKVPAPILAEVLCDVMGKALTDKAHRFLTLLGENQRLAALPDIAQLFRTYQASENAKVDAVLITSVKATSKMMQSFETALAEKLSCSVDMTNQVDQSIVGGAIIRVGDWVVDGSIQGKLARLSKALLA